MQKQSIAVFTVILVAGLVFLYISSPVKLSYTRQRMFPRLIARRKTGPLQYLKLVDISNKDLLAMNTNVTKLKKPPIYKDPKFVEGGCGVNDYKRNLEFKVTVWWMKFAAKHNITWFLTYGSLIGGIRHHDFVPWDHDADFGVLRQDLPLLLKHQTRRGQLHKADINLVCRPGDYCPWYGKSTNRMTCKGKKVTYMYDSCSFCGPVCRVVTWGGFLDLWLYSIELDSRTEKDFKLKVHDDGMSEYTTTKKYVDVDMMFPLRPCSFMGLTVLCPNKAKSYLNNVYGTWKSHYKCVKKKWKWIK